MEKVRIFETVDYAVVDYESASSIIVENAVQHISYGVFAMPVHGLMLAVNQGKLSEAVKNTDMIVPDGHPVRWAMNYFHKAGLKDRVYGPELTRHVLKKANEEKLKVFLYGGNTQETLDNFSAFISSNYPGITICGKYREPAAHSESMEAKTINESGAHIVLVGRGCPRQELWISRNKGKVNAVMMGVGAAFSFYAGSLEMAPKWMQDRGLEWLFRLYKEPRRLFKRYFVTNTRFLFHFLYHSVRNTFRINKRPQELYN